MSSPPEQNDPEHIEPIAPDGVLLDPERYAELRRIANGFIRNERIGHTLQATSLAHEAWLRLAKQDSFNEMARHDFAAAAAHMMRRILIDHARSKKTLKRGGGGLQLSLSDVADAEPPAGVDLLELDDALNRLAELNARHARVVELRFFAGLTIKETAELLEISDFTVKNDWRFARAWLLAELQQDQGS